MKVLITGSEGMIGKELVELLIVEYNEFDISYVDYKLGHDLRNFDICLALTKGIDIVFHLAGIKGNPRMTSEKPVDFMGPMLQFDTNMIIASQINGVKKFLYTSSIAVENPKTDKFPAWAKQTAETLIEAMRIQHPKGTEYYIVRPANVYGRHDNFSKKELMVISDLIRKGMTEDSIRLWDDGQSKRDFINAKDVARGMILAMKKMPKFPVNLCSGEGHKIKDIAKIVSNRFNIDLILGKPQKPNHRVMKPNWKEFKPKVKLHDGIKEVIDWKLKNLL